MQQLILWIGNAIQWVIEPNLFLMPEEIMSSSNIILIIVCFNKCSMIVSSKINSDKIVKLRHGISQSYASFSKCLAKLNKNPSLKRHLVVNILTFLIKVHILKTTKY